MAHVMAKDYDTAIRLLEAGPEPTFESFQSEMDTDDAIDFLHGLAFAYQETGAGEKAAAILEDVRSNLAGENAEGKNFPPIVVRTAQNAALRGEVREAIDTLQSAIELGFNDYYWIATDIWWGETAMQPEFHALLDAMKLRVDQQRSRFESMHDEQAFRAEIRALLQLP